MARGGGGNKKGSSKVSPEQIEINLEGESAFEDLTALIEMDEEANQELAQPTLEAATPEGMEDYLTWADQMQLASGGTSLTPEQEKEIQKALLDPAYIVGEAPDERGVPRTPWFATRQALEYSLAIRAGQDPATWAQNNAHLTFAQLVQLGRGEEPYYGATLEAQSVERLLRMSHPDHGSGYHMDAPGVFADALKAMGPGMKSGDPSQYTRGEMCRLLGYLQRESKEMSDDELRQLCWDAGLIPRWKNSPSHMELALRKARTRRQLDRNAEGRMEYNDVASYPRQAYSRQKGYHTSQRASQQLKNLRIALKTPYQTLLGSTYGSAGFISLREDHMHDVDQAELVAARFLPGVTGQALLQGDHHMAQKLMAQADIDNKKPASWQLYGEADEGNRPNRTAAPTRVEKKWGDKIQSFAESFGPSGLKKVHSYSVSGGWRKRTRGGASRAWGVYFPDSGELALNPKIEKLLHAAEKGKAEPKEIGWATKTLAHELIHSVSMRENHGNSYRKGTSEHTLEEGATESLARLHADRMARELGLWDKPESLRHSIDPKERNDSYKNQVLTMLFVAEACTSGVDDNKEYWQPEEVTPEAQKFLHNLHTDSSKSYEDRKKIIAERLSEKTGAVVTVQEVTSLLRECQREKRYGFVWSLQPSSEEGKGSQWNIVQRNNLLDTLKSKLNTFAQSSDAQTRA